MYFENNIILLEPVFDRTSSLKDHRTCTLVCRLIHKDIIGLLSLINTEAVTFYLVRIPVFIFYDREKGLSILYSGLNITTAIRGSAFNPFQLHHRVFPPRNCCHGCQEAGFVVLALNNFGSNLDPKFAKVYKSWVKNVVLKLISFENNGFDVSQRLLFLVEMHCNCRESEKQASGVAVFVS